MEDDMGDFANPLAEMAPTVEPRRVSYEVWCQCTRLLLGWTDDAGEIPSALYAAGMTPLAAVRHMVFGSQQRGQ
jgi:hypothetical protein